MTIYTDGACRGNPGPGGCAAILVDSAGRQTEISRGFRRTTNNRMEILSVILALQATPPETREVALVSDSKYVLDTLQKRWIAGWRRRGWMSSKREPVKNQDLWEILDRLIARHTVTYTWVKGHASHPLNNRCDELAVAAARGSALEIDAAFEGIGPGTFTGPTPLVLPRAKNLPPQLDLFLQEP